MTEPDPTPEGDLRECHADPLTEAELAQLKADIEDMADGWGRAAMVWLAIPDAFSKLAPRITAVLAAQQAELRGLRAQLAERWPHLAHQSRDRLFALCQAVGVVREDQWLSEAAVAAIEKLQSDVDSLQAQLASAAPPPA